MAAKIRMLAAVAWLGLVVGPAWSQQEVIPAPAPSGPVAPDGKPYRPNATYDSLQAGQDAYQRGEEERRWAIDRQLQVEQNIIDYNVWSYYNWGMPHFYGYGNPYVGMYAPPEVGFRLRRAFARWGYWPPLYPTPLSPDSVYGYQYRPFAKQPIGHEKIWTGPNSYIYKPRYASPEPPPGPPAFQPAPPPGAPMPASPPGAQPPAIVNPPNAPVPAGPREF